ncbi:sensor domain-containing diguanylate cyclase [Trinickia dinghuensis]|uniref:diguanylate cyclase n=1 Tax=Trinickia dinghuensis TaxID=2291023 RepID=A0A3D8K1G4_9BURK|nr:sensor domain-containing diguanylate cyclase [Trinickia dinghuensis]RDU99273.1 diguanylate cyclase [Trinickia dinghuensis]
MKPATPNTGTALDTTSAAPVDLFDLTPTSLWIEDYSSLRALFETWRSEGVTDLRAFLTADTRRVAQCSACIRVLKVNRRTLEMYGARDFDELSARLGDVLRDDMLEAHIEELETMWSGSLSFESKSVNYRLDGRRLDILLKGLILPGHEASWDRVLVAIDDITDLEDARRRATASHEYAQGLFEHAPVSLWIEDFRRIKALIDEVREQGIMDFRTFTDVHPEFVERCMAEIVVLDVNRHTIDLFKADDKAALLGRLPEVFRDDMRPHFREQLIELWDGRLFQQREVLNYSLDGNEVHLHLQFSVFPGHEREWDLVLLALTDITARKKAEAYLEYLGKHDVLTKLKNRSFYVDELNRLERKGPFPVSAIIVDLNHLKTVNDQLGHAAGDALLRRAGEVLAKAIHKPYQAARIGGDEFAVLLPGANERETEVIADSIRQIVELNNQFYSGPALSFSMGWATCDRGERIEDMLREADSAMYEDKRRHHAPEPRAED